MRFAINNAFRSRRREARAQRIFFVEKKPHQRLLVNNGRRRVVLSVAARY
jgi:hypothetical protein